MRPTEVVVCLAPVPEDNRGDQALTIATVEELKKRGADRIVLVATSQHPIEAYSDSESLKIRKNVHFVFSTDRCFKERLRWILLLIKAKKVLLIGADVLDEGYSSSRSLASFWAIGIAGRIGVASRVIGFSVNGVPSPRLRDRILELKNTKLFVRDPVSFRRMSKADIPNVELAGDLAFLLEPAEWKDVPATVVQFVERHENRVIGINLTEGVFGESPSQNLTTLSKALQLLAERDGFRFLLIPHENQGGIEYLAQFQLELDQEQKGICEFVSPLPSAKQLKAIAGQCVHIFTCRLHLGIATLGMARPVTCFPYQGKFEGQFEHMKLSSDGLIDLADFPIEPEELYGVLLSRIEQSDEISAAIKQRLPEIKKLALKNFDSISV
ncbi:polysaccharide pyruvyl transferase family protein [bacterium]|nr:polysaccharide pyruvyl transferase family protein [bacterium]MDB4802321.1 polysaccharide pyruvyl transferase family protein [bacterium]